MESAAPLGRLLVSSGLLTQEALDEVIALQKADGRRLGDILADKGLVRPHQLAQFLSHQLACPWVSLQRVEIAPEAVEKLPREIARRHRMVPVHLRSSRGVSALYVAMDDPTDDAALSEATTAATMPVKAMVALSSEITEHLDRLYPPLPPEPPPPPPPPVVVPEGSFPPVPPKTNPTMPRPAVSKPPPPLPISKATQAAIAQSSGSTPNPPPVVIRESSSILEVSAVIDIDEQPPESHSSAATPHILVVEPSEQMFDRVRAAARSVAAFATSAKLPEAKEAVANTTICALVVGAETYANERAAIDRLANDSNAPLIISNETFAGPQLLGLLRGAVDRWRRAAYEKGSVLEGCYELVRDLTPRTRPKRVVTWEVKHVRTERRSVIKIGLRANEYSGVRREQYALARVHHPGALELRDAGSTELGDPFIVVESVEGKTLEGLVAGRGALEMAEACTIIRQLAEILAAAHEAGVRHSSVRPEHVVVARDAWGTERVKLVGWEAASVDDASSSIAPDLYGAGVCAFLALVGRKPNEKEDGHAIKDVALASVVGLALAKEGTLKSFAEGLEGALTARAPTLVLAANPEKRGASMRPPAAPPPTEIPQEMRRFARAPYRTPVRVEVAGIGAVDGRSEDISCGGLFVVTRGHIADRAQVTIRFALPIDGKVVSEMAIVKWSRAPNADDVGAVRAIGIELVSPGAETTKQVARYVQYMANEAG